jgi:uncharacterized RDD family membrane protein YckC
MLILRRLGAYACDYAIVLIAVTVCFTIYLIFGTEILQAIQISPALLSDKALLLKEMDNFLPLPSRILLALLMLAASFAYFILLESSKKQATLGKRLFNLKVSSEQGRGMSVWHACQRYFWFALPSILYLLLCVVKKDSAEDAKLSMKVIAILLMHAAWYFPILVTPDNRSAYDILSRTKVVSSS